MERTELETKLRDQLRLLGRSAAAFDAGDPAEFLNLATRVRVLVHDTKGSTSLLSQLGIKDVMLYMDTSTPSPAMVVPVSDQPSGAHVHVAFGGLATIRMTTGAPPRFIASLRTTNQWIIFRDWWESPAMHDAAGNTFSRMELILTVANKEGGAHIDTHLDGAYEALSRANSVGVVWTHQDGVSPLENPVPVCVRQIAHELEYSISAHTAGVAQEGG